MAHNHDYGRKFVRCILVVPQRVAPFTKKRMAQFVKKTKVVAEFSRFSCSASISSVQTVIFGSEKAFSTPQCLMAMPKAGKMKAFFSEPYKDLKACSS